MIFLAKQILDTNISCHGAEEIDDLQGFCFSLSIPIQSDIQNWGQGYKSLC